MGHSCVQLRALLPQLDPAVIALRNRVYAAPPCPLRGGRIFVWQDSGRFTAVGALHCRLGPSTLHLAADHLSLLEPRLQGFESFVPSEALTALVEHALAPVLELIERLAGHPVACEEFRPIEPLAATQPASGAAAAESMVSIGFVLLGPNRVPEIRGWLNAAPSFWQALAFTRTPLMPTGRFQAVPIGLSVQLGQCSLPLEELRQLETGDALRITPRIPRRRNGGLPVRVVDRKGLFGCRARLVDDQLTLETPMNPMTDTSPLRPNSPTPTKISEEQLLSSIENELTFELGSMRMTLAEIARLRVGQAVRLGIGLQDQPVRILTAGRLIARGELAAVGDELVVVVTETAGLPHV